MKRPQKLAVMLVPTPPYEICGSAPCPFCWEQTTAPLAVNFDQPDAPPEPEQEMVAALAPAAVPGALIRFECPRCRGALTIPESMGEVEGPCYHCGTQIRAPQKPPICTWRPARQPANQQPPPKREYERRSKSKSGPTRSDNLADEHRGLGDAMQSPSGSSSEEDFREADEHPRRRRVCKRRKSSESRKRFAGILAFGVLTFGVAGGVVFLVGPGRHLFDNESAETIKDEDDYQRVAALQPLQQGLEQKRTEAIADAISCVRGFLRSADWKEAKTFVIGQPQPSLGVPMALPRASPADVELEGADRKPGTASFVVKHRLKTADGNSAVLWGLQPR